MPYLGIGLQEQGKCSETFGTVTRSGDGNHQCGPHRRNGAWSVLDQRSAPNHSSRNAQLVLQCQANAFAGILRATRTSEDDILNSLQGIFQSMRIGDYQVCRIAPTYRLLANLAQGVEVALLLLTGWRLTQQFLSKRLSGLKGTKPIGKFDSSIRHAGPSMARLV